MRLYFDDSVNCYYLTTSRQDSLDGHITARCISINGNYDYWHQVPIEEFIEMNPLEFDIGDYNIDEIIL
jgi:hypothetical protein